MSRALVLGGGGPVGIAWETGLIAGLADRGVKVQHADFILGTSAGSVIVSQVLLPSGMTLGKIDLWKDGAALEGRAPDDAAVREWAQALERSGEVRNPQVAWVRREGDQVAYRVLINFLCAAPGERNVCLPATGSAYTQQQVEDALRPVLGNGVTLTKLVLRDGKRGQLVELEGGGSEAEVRAALERVRQQIPWLTASSYGIGQGSFSALLRMVCTVPPPATPGICAAPSPPR